jgi:hypothetical protein
MKALPASATVDVLAAAGVAGSAAATGALGAAASACAIGALVLAPSPPQAARNSAAEYKNMRRCFIFSPSS